MPTKESKKQLSEEVRQLRRQVTDLRKQLDSAGKDSASEDSGAQSIVGGRALTLRYDADARRNAYGLLAAWQKLAPQAIYFCRYYNNMIRMVPALAQRSAPLR